MSTYEELEKFINIRIVQNIKDYYDCASKHPFMAERALSRIMEDLSIAEAMGIISHDQWFVCLDIIMEMGTGSPVDDRLTWEWGSQA